MAKTDLKTKDQGGALMVIDFAADAGMGLENMTSQDMAIPFFNVLQKLSPQCDTIEGAKAGMIFNTVTEQSYKEITVIPCAYKRDFVEWRPRASGGGLVGQHTITSEVVSSAKNIDGKLTTASGNVLVETAYHFVLSVSDSGSIEPGLIVMSSTQLKKNRRWNSLMNNLKVQGPNGMVTPARFSHMYKLSTIQEQNDKGAWYGWTIDMVGPVTNPGIYQAARDFAQQVSSGTVKTAAPEQDHAETVQHF
jgi:hypothetical protein